MTTLLLTLALFCGQFDDELAIAIAINAPQPAQQSVITEPELQPSPAIVKQHFTTRQETRTRRVWGKIRCTRNGCQYGWINETYTVSVKVPVSGNWPHYPTTNKTIWRLNGGRGAEANWQHLTGGPHRGKFSESWLKTLPRDELNALHSDDHEGTVKWEFVVRP